MIYVGYPCIGKSSIAGQDNFIDLESSNFKHLPNWVEEYVKIAQLLNSQGYNIFLSTHKEVRDELKKQQLTFVCIFPGIELYNRWFERLASRYKHSPSDKNLRALEHVTKHYKEDIDDLMTEDIILVIHDIKYNLIDFIKSNKPQSKGRSTTIDFDENGNMHIEYNSRSGKTLTDIWKDQDSLLDPPQ